MQKASFNRAGHVAEPRGRARWPAWQAKVTRGPYLLYILYINIMLGVPRVQGDEILISLIRFTFYTRYFISLIPCGTKVPFF